MLQDLAEGRLENEFMNPEPRPEDVVICVRQGDMLLKRGGEDSPVFPTAAQVCTWSGGWNRWGEKGLQYAFALHGVNYFLWMGEAGECPDGAFAYGPARGFREMTCRERSFAAMTGWHLYRWYASSRFCGRCGSRTVHDEKERMMRCPECGNLIFPRINPAVIVAVTDGDRIVMTKYAGRDFTRYALIAGFTEIGETLEQTVQREVLEEVGLKVKNIRYYKSQPWGIDGNILMGFFCDLDGDDTIHIDERELSVGEWHHRSSGAIVDDGISLTREMMRVFSEGKEPK